MRGMSTGEAYERCSTAHSRRVPKDGKRRIQHSRLIEVSGVVIDDSWYEQSRDLTYDQHGCKGEGRRLYVLPLQKLDTTHSGLRG